MSTVALPAVAALVFGAHPYYAAKSLIGIEAPVMWFDQPVLPNDRVRWALHAEVKAEHAILDMVAYAELLFLADVEPLLLSDDEVMAAIGWALTACGCDLARCAAEVCGEIAEHPECAQPRMSRCVARAARLLKVEA